jgi:hypothetical protein
MSQCKYLLLISVILGFIVGGVCIKYDTLVIMTLEVSVTVLTYKSPSPLVSECFNA